MKKEELKKLVGQRVIIRFFDQKEMTGVLGFTENFSAEYGFRKPGYFTIGDTDFCVSHVRKLRVESGQLFQS